VGKLVKNVNYIVQSYLCNIIDRVWAA